MQGKIKSYSGKGRDSKGYGFIVSDDVEGDIFFHFTNLKSDIEVGDVVEFDLVKHEKGLRANCVAKVEQ